MTSLKYDTVQFYWDFSSNNTYFAFHMLREMVKRINGKIDYVPTYLGALFKERNHSVADHGNVKLKYLSLDHKRWASRTGLPFKHPEGDMFPIKTSDAMRGFFFAKKFKMEELYIEKIMAAYWEDNLDISNVDVLANVVSTTLWLDGERFKIFVKSQEAKEALFASTQVARDHGVFGAPQFTVNNELFWGKDRLEFVEDWMRVGEILEKGVAISDLISSKL